MNKRRIIISRAVKDLSVFAVIALSLLSCIEGDLYELYDEDECVVDCQISRRKRKQFDGGLNTSIGGQSESVFDRTCFICVAAYYKNDKKGYGNYMKCYYEIFDDMIKTYYGGSLPSNYDRSYEANKWFVEKKKFVYNTQFAAYLVQYASKSFSPVYYDENQQPFNSETLKNYIESYKNNHNLSNDDFIIDGNVGDRLHFAIYNGYTMHSDGTIQINTFDPGPGNQPQTMSSVAGVFVVNQN